MLLHIFCITGLHGPELHLQMDCLEDEMFQGSGLLGALANQLVTVSVLCLIRREGAPESHCILVIV